MKKLNTSSFRFDGKRAFSAKDTPTLIEPFYTDEADRAHQLDQLSDRMDQAQNTMHADDMGNEQLIIAYIVTEILESLPVSFPQRDDKEAERLIKVIEKQDQ